MMEKDVCIICSDKITDDYVKTECVICENVAHKVCLDVEKTKRRIIIISESEFVCCKIIEDTINDDEEVKSYRTATDEYQINKHLIEIITILKSTNNLLLENNKLLKENNELRKLNSSNNKIYKMQMKLDECDEKKSTYNSLRAYSHKIKGVESKSQIFIGNVNKDCTIKTLTDHIKDITGCDDKDFECIVLNTKSTGNCYIVKITEHFVSDIIREGKWPKPIKIVKL